MLQLDALLQSDCTLQSACQLITSHRAVLHLWLASDQLLQAAAQSALATQAVQALSLVAVLTPHLHRWAF